MAWPASTLSPAAPGGDEEEAEEAEPRLLPRSSPTPRPRPAEEEAAAAGGGGARRVRFADALGLPLVAVQCYDSLCEARGLPLAAGPRHCSPCGCDAPGGHQQEALCDGHAHSPDPAQELGALGPARRGPQGHFYLFPTFLLPANPQQLAQRVQAGAVELESLLPCPADRQAMRGVLRVLNLSYRKSVYVRASFDRWTSYYDHPADYLAPCDDGRTDQFAFRLAFVPPYDFDGARLEFVVRYETPAQTFWANNGGRNYGVVLKAAGGGPASPPVKRVVSEVEQRRLKSCLKPVKNRFAEEFSGMIKAQDTFPTAGLTIEEDVVPHLVKPTPLHPERPNNQVPTLVVTSTSPETFHSYRPMTFTESDLELDATKDECVSTSSKPIIGLRKPSGEDENRPRKDKSTWIGDLNTLRHAGSRFLNGDDGTTGLGQDLMPEKSLLERPLDHPPSRCYLDHPYIVPTLEDSDNEDAVEAELEQLYLSHLSRLQAAKELKEPGEVDMAQGIADDSHGGTDWHTHVSPLDLAGTKRILNTWLVEEISLRHANGREEEEVTNVAHVDVELPSSVCESPPSHQERWSEKKEVSSPVSVQDSLEDSLAEEEGKAPCNIKSSNDKAQSFGKDLPKMPGGGDSAQTSALDHTSQDPSHKSPAWPGMKATDSVLSCASCEFVSVTQDSITLPGCHLDRTVATLDTSTGDTMKILPKAEGDNSKSLETKKNLLTQDPRVGALSIYFEHSSQITPEQESKEACGLETSQHLKVNVQPSQERSGLESYKNVLKTALPDQGLSRREPLQHLRENALLSQELSGLDAFQKLQDSAPLSAGHSQVDTSQILHEDALLSQELSQLETSESVQDERLLSQELSRLEQSHNLQESVLLREEFCGLATSNSLQGSAPRNREMSLRGTARNKQEIILLSEELSRRETSEHLQESILLSEELSVLETSQNLQEIVLLNEELCGLGTSRHRQERFLLREGVSGRETFQNLPLTGEGALNECTLSAVLEEEFGYKSSSRTLLGDGLAYLGSSAVATQEGLEYPDSTPPGDGLGYLGSSSALLGERVGCHAFRGKKVGLVDSSPVRVGEGLEQPDPNPPLLDERLLCRGSSSSALLVEGLDWLDSYSAPHSEEVVRGGCNSAGNSDASSALQGEEAGYSNTSSAQQCMKEGCPDSRSGLSGEELDFPDSIPAHPGEKLEFVDSGPAPPGDELKFLNSSPALPGEELEFLDSSPALLCDRSRYSDSCSIPVGESLQVRDLGLRMEAALSQSFSFLCAVVLLLVMLQDCTSSVAVLLLLMSVWFL
ncbi:protein phosphatase 1 regulatory subunit 3F [Lissotriton helveticus]